jgi:pyridoxal phosphate enzyme (YggS family)
VAGLTVDAQPVRDRIAAACDRARRDPAGVELLAAVKYVDVSELGALADAGIELLGENRAQELESKAQNWPAFRWHFIGQLQSRKVRQIVPYAQLIHSVASESALEQLGRFGTPETEVLVQVNVAGEAGKAGIAPEELRAFIARCPVNVVGLMTMPPEAGDPEANRPHFRALSALARDHGLRHLSMGTSQDYEVAVEEGATIVRVGSALYSRV